MIKQFKFVIVVLSVLLAMPALAASMRAAAWLTRRCAPALVLLALVAGASHAAALSGTYTDASAATYYARLGNNFVSVVDCLHYSGLSPCGGGARQATALFDATSSGTPAMGVVSANALVSTNPYWYQYSYANVQSYWFDTFTVSSSTVPIGSFVNLALRVDLVDALSASVVGSNRLCDGTGGYTACASDAAFFNSTSQGGQLALVSHSVTDNPAAPSTATYLLPVRVGSDVTLVGELSVYTSASLAYGGGQDASHEAGATATAYFYVDPQAGVSILSASGHNYGSASPVPEPETYAMMLAGLGLLGFVARRRKQKAA